MSVLRPVRESDFGSIAGLLMRAFLPTEPNFSLPAVDFLRMQAGICPAACLVVQAGAQLAGVVFGASIGNLGLIGPLAVSPDRQHQGIGRELLAAGMEALHKAGCNTFGLDSGNSASLVDFYQKAGFRIVCETSDGLLSLNATRQGCSDELKKQFSERLIFSQCRNGSFQRLFQQVQSEFWPGIDYLPIVQRLHQHGRGDGLLLLEQHEPRFSAILEYGSRSSGESAAVVRLKAVLSRSPGSLVTALPPLESFIRDRFPFCRHLYVRISAEEWPWLGQRGYSHQRSGLRWLAGLEKPADMPFFCIWE